MEMFMAKQKKLENKKKNSNQQQKALDSLANSIYENLKEEGYQSKDIIGVSSKLIGLVTSAIEDKKS